MFRAELTQYGSVSYTLNPRAGGMRGTATRSTFERKNKTTTQVHAWKGGSQSYDARSVLRRVDNNLSGMCKKRRPPETDMLISASG